MSSLSDNLDAARVVLGKRKEREQQAQEDLVPPPAPPAKDAAATPPAPAQAQSEQVGSSCNDEDKLLAGHLAHEYCTRGTLLGRRIEPSDDGGTVVPPLTAADSKQAVRKQMYEEMSRLLMSGEANIPGIVNPTQLGHWLQKDD